MHIKLTDQIMQSQFNTYCHMRQGGFLLIELLIACLIGLMMTYIMICYESSCIITSNNLIKRWHAINVLEVAIMKAQIRKEQVKTRAKKTKEYVLYWNAIDQTRDIWMVTAVWQQAHKKQHVSLVARVTP